MAMTHDMGERYASQKARPRGGKFMTALGKMADGDLEKLHKAITAEMDRREKKKEDTKSPADMSGPEFERWSKKLIEEGDSSND
jgi:hypothetical protein